MEWVWTNVFKFEADQEKKWTPSCFNSGQGAQMGLILWDVLHVPMKVLIP